MTTLASLLVQETKAALYAKALEVAVLVGLPVTSWEEGDATRSLYHLLSETLSTLEFVAARYVASGFLDLAARLDDPKWVVLLAEQQYGYVAREASYATCSVLLTNAGGGVYTVDAQSLTFAKTAEPEITYRNTSGGTLQIAPGTLAVDVECEVAGSDGSAGIGDLQLVTVLGAGTVTATNTTASVGVDEESVTSIVAGCRAKLASLSGMGPAGIYAYVALNSTLTGTTNVTRVRVKPYSTTGEVVVVVAGAGGSLPAADVQLVEDAILEWATPLCITPSVFGAGETSTAITAEVKVYDSINATAAEIATAVEDAIDTMLAALPIGGDGDDGKLYRAKLIATIKGAFPEYIIDVTLTAPAADVTVAYDRVATKGVVTITSYFQVAP